MLIKKVVFFLGGTRSTYTLPARKPSLGRIAVAKVWRFPNFRFPARCTDFQIGYNYALHTNYRDKLPPISDNLSR